MYFEYYLMGIILLPGIIIAIIAQSKVSSAYNKYNKVLSKSNVVASDLIRQLLVNANLSHISVNQIPGHLSDYYDPKNETICLSSGVYNSSSIASLGIACHEFGHALQKKENYAPYKIRQFLIPVTNVVSSLLWPLVIIGLLFNIFAMPDSIIGSIFLWCGIAFFGISVIINLATLPVEYNASNRAITILRESGILDEEELKGTKKVLNAAALTYVASLLISILNLIRFLLVVNRDRE